MLQIKIADRTIGKGCSPFIIAEAGINHNGEIEKALFMIEIAKESGADAIKFQTFKAEEFISDPSLTYTYKTQGKKVTESMFDMFKRYEFTKDSWHLIKKKCNEEKIIFLSTPQNLSDLNLLIEIGIPAIKVGSDDFTNFPLLKSYSQTKLPIIISCGMADLAEVYQALMSIGSLDDYPTVLMVCTSQYPTPPEDVNLLRLKTLSCTFPNIILGFSDHTQGALASSIAVALGASVFEKHFTIDHDLHGPDHWFSENPQGLKDWIISIKKSFLILGSGIVKPTYQELMNRKELRRVIVAAQNIEEGSLFTTNNLSMSRVSGGQGLSPEIIDFLVDKKAIRDFKKGEVIEL